MQRFKDMLIFGEEVDSTSAKRIIQEHNLKLADNIWHYSFNDVLDSGKRYLFRSWGGKTNLFSLPLNQWSPVKMYSNYEGKNLFLLRNSVTATFNPMKRDKRQVFWYLKVDDFQNFLERRSRISSNPKRHFPTLFTYDKIKNKEDIRLEIREFKKEKFAAVYDFWRPPEFLSSKDVISSFYKHNPSLPTQWIKTALLFHKNETVAVALLVDDTLSISLINITAKRSNLSYGVFLCTEVVKHCCENQYKSFNAGISNIYGVYKDKIFLDSWETSPRDTIKLNNKWQFKLF